MIKFYPGRNVAYDIETVPCLKTARRIYPEIADVKDDAEALRRLYLNSGATTSNPKPFLRHHFHSVVSIAIVAQTEEGFGRLSSYSIGDSSEEGGMLTTFLDHIGKRKPRLIGFSSGFFDFPVLMKRALLTGAVAPLICQRPESRWKGVDYFDKYSDCHFDLLEALSSSSKESKFKLDDLCRALGVPGKVGMTGSDVADAWYTGDIGSIAFYNECDAASTFLAWIHVQRMCGQLSPEQFVAVVADFRKHLADRVKINPMLEEFLAEWEVLDAL